MIRILLILLLLLVLAVPVSAQEDTTDTTQDNWCFNPAIWAGDCGDGTTFESRWMWICGWYMAGFDRGDITREFIATRTYCLELLPPLPATSEGLPAETPFEPICYDSSTTYEDVHFMGLSEYSPYYKSQDGTCTGDPLGTIVIVEAADYDAAVAACLPFAPYHAAALSMADFGYPLPSTYWACLLGGAV